MAHKKAAGSAKNLRDSNPKYRGVKVFGGQPVVAGNIIIRQKGTKYECGSNTYETKDFTIHAAIDGLVTFKKKNFKRFDGRTYLKTVVEVFPVEETKKPTPKASKAAPVKKAVVAKPANKEVAAKAPVAETAEKKAPAKKAVTAKSASKEVAAKAPAKKASSAKAAETKTPAAKKPAAPKAAKSE